MILPLYQKISPSKSDDQNHPPITGRGAAVNKTQQCAISPSISVLDGQDFKRTSFRIFYKIRIINCLDGRWDSAQVHSAVFAHSSPASPITSITCMKPKPVCACQTSLLLVGSIRLPFSFLFALLIFLLLDFGCSNNWIAMVKWPKWPIQLSFIMCLNKDCQQQFGNLIKSNRNKNSRSIVVLDDSVLLCFELINILALRWFLMTYRKRQLK